MASGIMSAQRALGSTVGFAVLGSVLAASLTVTLSEHLAQAIPDPAERREVADTIIGDANPRAYAAEIGPGRPIQHADPATREAILRAADADFVEGIRISLGAAILVLALVLAAGFAVVPAREGRASPTRRREEKSLESEEAGRASPEGAGNRLEAGREVGYFDGESLVCVSAFWNALSQEVPSPRTVTLPKLRVPTWKGRRARARMTGKAPREEAAPSPACFGLGLLDCEWHGTNQSNTPPPSDFRSQASDSGALTRSL